MKNLTHNKNFWAIVAIVALIAVALIVGLNVKQPAPKVVEGDSDSVSIITATAEPAPVATEAPTAEPTATAEPAPVATEAPTAEPTATAEPAPVTTEVPTAAQAASVTDLTDDGDVASTTDLATDSDLASATDLATATDAQPAKAYVIVTAGNESRIFPVPDEGEYSFTVVMHHEGADDSENVVHITSEGMYMERSTCENQDCVEQGTVTLDNRQERALFNMIVCLPNQVMLELYTPEEIEEMFSQAE